MPREIKGLKHHLRNVSAAIVLSSCLNSYLTRITVVNSNAVVFLNDDREILCNDTPALNPIHCLEPPMAACTYVPARQTNSLQEGWQPPDGKKVMGMGRHLPVLPPVVLENNKITMQLLANLLHC